MKTIRTRLSAAASIAAVSMIVLAPMASADSEGSIVIEGEDGYIGVVSTSIDLDSTDGWHPEVFVNEDGEYYMLDDDGNVVILDPSVVNADGEFDRSGLARIATEDGTGDEPVTRDLGVDEDGDGYVDIVPIDADLSIVPISADVDGGVNAWIIVAAVAGIGAVGAATFVGMKRRADAANA
ncbi:MAG: hypothetical protein FWD83_01930 [Promicromonosporaceae bacterium]|nr:hypothetical protein [Promicromonosporaceae bacterium]